VCALDRPCHSLCCKERERERDAITEQFSKLKAECDMKVKHMEREKAELIEANKKQVKPFEEPKEVIQNTQSGLRFFSSRER